MTMWPQKRAQELQEKTRFLLSKPKIKVLFQPSPEAAIIDYFPKDIAKSLASYGDQRFEIVDEATPSGVDILILTAHGSDVYVPLWNIRSVFRNSIIALWLWDNHSDRFTNFKSALASDYIFPSHKYASAYLSNPASVGAHVPLCSAQWTHNESRDIFDKFSKLPRNDKLFVNYVDYPSSWRSKLLRRLETEMPEADVLLMAPENRSRYFNKSREDRLREWMDYKVSLILPLGQDLSTRVFDGLLSGQALLVPKMVSDFNEVIPPSDQSELGIVRLETLEISEIRQAHREAVACFDRGGMEGIMKRHRFVLEHHMLGNRIQMMVNQILDVASGKLCIAFAESERKYSLHLTVPPFQG